MLDGVTIRAGTPDDYSTIADLWKTAGGFCSRCCHPAARQRWPKILAYVIALSSVSVATMDVNGTEVIVGFVVSESPKKAKHRSILHSLYVREQCRREGIGRALWDAANLSEPMFLTHMAGDGGDGWARILRQHKVWAMLDASLFWRHSDAALPPEATSQKDAHVAHSDRVASP